MKNIQLRALRNIAFSMVTIITVYSCNNNDTTDSTNTSVTDTTSMMQIDSSGMIADSALRSEPVNTAVDTASTSSVTTPRPEPGLAKPNPAKKGMKGKAIVSAPSKSTAKMEADASGVYANAEYLPTYPGGAKALQQYFNDNIEYPSDASNEGIEGTVNVSFVVDENGKLSSPQVVGEKMGYGLEEEALRMIRTMPSWNAGKLKGKNVKTRYTLPIRFSLY